MHASSLASTRPTLAGLLLLLNPVLFIIHSLHRRSDGATILLKSHQRIPIVESNFTSLPWPLDPHDAPSPASLSSALAPTPVITAPTALTCHRTQTCPQLFSFLILALGFSERLPFPPNVCSLPSPNHTAPFYFLQSAYYYLKSW